MPFSEWVGLDYRLAHDVWQGPGVLKFMPVGEAHSVWWFRDDHGNFTNWYVNLEDPAIRWDDGTVAGVDMVDQDLDIVVAPDRTWRWKDEDEFAERLAFPDHYWVPDSDSVWAEGKRVVERIEAGEFPFDGTWTDFRPDPSWEPGAPLPGWDRPVLERC